jgi:ribosomal protein L40E
MKICPICGHENEDDAVFCEICRTGIRDVPPAEPGTVLAQPEPVWVKYCPACGAENPAESDRCRCGAFLADAERVRKKEPDSEEPLKLTFASGAVVILTAKENILGREYQSDLVWDDDPYVSGAHLRIRRRGGKWYAQDISANGTERNGRPMPAGEAVLLGQKDRLRAGRTEFQVTFEKQKKFRRVT